MIYPSQNCRNLGIWRRTDSCSRTECQRQGENRCGKDDSGWIAFECTIEDFMLESGHPYRTFASAGKGRSKLFNNVYMEYFNLEMDWLFRSVDFRQLFFATSQMPDHYSHNILQGIKWKLSISSFYWYLIIWNCPSGLRAIASQSEAVFPKFQKCT